MKSLFSPKNLVIIGLIFFALVSRLIYHIPNVSPITAIALFGAAFFTDKRLAFSVPLLIMLLSDLIIGMHNTMLFVYIGVVLSALLGIVMLKKTSFVRVAGASLLSSIIFFLVTNFGVWLAGWYPPTFEGLIKSYTMAIPFFRYSVIGDLAFCGVLFGSLYLVEKYVPKIFTEKVYNK
ncbi:MAG: DUF6580 family putative transport protein [Bacteroidota bacterium]